MQRNAGDFPLPVVPRCKIHLRSSPRWISSFLPHRVWSVSGLGANIRSGGGAALLLWLRMKIQLCLWGFVQITLNPARASLVLHVPAASLDAMWEAHVQKVESPRVTSLSARTELRGESQNLKTHHQSPNVWLESGSTQIETTPPRWARYIYLSRLCWTQSGWRCIQVACNLLQTKRVDDLEASLQGGLFTGGEKEQTKERNGVKKRVQSGPCLPGFPVVTEALRFKRRGRAERGSLSPCSPPAPHPQIEWHRSEAAWTGPLKACL